MNLTDDIFVWGTDEEDHDKNLHAVLERLSTSGLTLNEDKIELKKKELDFFGLHFSSNGISVQSGKADAILNATPPKDAKEVRSFLGLANYCSRFIQDFASLAEPLRELTKKNNQWSWEEKHINAFEQIKLSLSKNSMAYFNPTWRTELTIDASPAGLGCVMAQYNLNNINEKKMISFNSRTLSDVEKRYSQTEKEALGLVWACEKLHLYLIGCEFDVITDNKAVELIFNNPYSKPKARIERWCLRLMPYKFNVKHKPGLENIADYLSRNPIQVTTHDDYETIAESYINTITKYSIPSAVNRKDLIYETNNDPILIEIKKLINNEKHNKKVEFYKSFTDIQNELSITSDGLILRNTKVIIPNNIQKQIIQIAHASHQGIVKTKQLIRSHVWFPNIDRLVEDAVKTCSKCQANIDNTRFNPLQMTKLPDGPWEMLATDFFGPLSNGIYLLVLIDLYSRYPVVKKIKSTAAKSVIPTLDDIFAHYGIPIELKSDNGPPFKSYEFKLFAENLGFYHHRIMPYWPRANATCENFMKSLGKILKINGQLNVNWEKDLVEFLRNYRSTPNSSTKIAPMKLLFQTKSITSRLPNYRIQNENKSELQIQAKENDERSKSIMKTNGDLKLRTMNHSFKINDLVLLKQVKTNKCTPQFDPEPFKIVNIKGTMISIERNNRQYARNASMLKLFLTSNEANKSSHQIQSKKKKCLKNTTSIDLDRELEVDPIEQHLTPPQTPAILTETPQLPLIQQEQNELNDSKNENVAEFFNMVTATNTVKPIIEQDPNSSAEYESATETEDNSVANLPAKRTRQQTKHYGNVVPSDSRKRRD